MALDFQEVDIKFTQGLDTRTQAKLVIPGKWNQLENVSLDKDGTPVRRDGVVALVAGASGNGLATHNNQLLVINGGSVNSLTTAGIVDTAVSVPGGLGHVFVNKNEIRRSTGMQDSPDIATISGLLTCYVWRELTGAAVQTGLNVSVVDEVTGAQLVSNGVLRTGATAFCPRVVAIEATAASTACFLIFYIDGTSLYCRVIDSAAPTVVGAEVALITSVSLAAINFDAIAYGFETGSLISRSTAMVSYGWADGVTSVRTIQVTQVATVPSIQAGPANLFTQVQLPVATLAAIACVAFSDVADGAGTFVVSTGGAAMAGLAGAVIDNAWAVAVAATLLDGTVPAVAGFCSVTGVLLSDGSVSVFFDQRMNWSTAGLTPIRGVQATIFLTILSGPTTVINSASFAGGATDPAGPKGPWIGGKAFAVGLNVFLPVHELENYQNLGATKATNNEQSSIFILDVSFLGSLVVAKALYGTLGVTTINNNAPRLSTPCSTVDISGGFLNVYAMAATERSAPTFVGGLNVAPTGLVELIFSPNFTTPPIKTQLGESTYVAGGSLGAYDGRAMFEATFPLFPEGINVEVVAAGGAMTAGIHQVVVIAEWVDNAGQRKQSAPSLPVSATTALNDRLRVRVPSLLLGQMTGVYLVPYITQANGITFNRAVTGIGNGTPNDATVAFTTLALIDAADATYSSNELLYTQPFQPGFALPNIAQGPTSAIASHQGRIWYDKTDQPGQFGYSQKYINNIGLQFSDDLGGSVDVSGGNIVGFSTLDEKMIIFCENKPFVVYGSGPQPDGSSNNYSDAQEIPSDTGCVDARSILKMPNGIIFKSQKGWQLLGRDLQVHYIGDGVSAYDANTVTSAVLMEDRQQCRFSSSDGPQLIYCYDTQGGPQWATTAYKLDSGAAVVDYFVDDAVYWSVGGYYASVSLTQGLNRDTPGVFLDRPGAASVNKSIATTMRTAWLRMSIINGFQRVRDIFLTGTSPNAPTSTLAVTCQFNDAYGASVDPGSYGFNVVYSTVFPAFTVGTSVDVRHSMRTQKCKSVAFTFVDTPTTANPAGVNFQALSLRLGMKRGLRKLPAAQSG